MDENDVVQVCEAARKVVHCGKPVIVTGDCNRRAHRVSVTNGVVMMYLDGAKAQRMFRLLVMSDYRNGHPAANYAVPVDKFAGVVESGSFKEFLRTIFLSKPSEAPRKITISRGIRRA